MIIKNNIYIYSVFTFHRLFSKSEHFEKKEEKEESESECVRIWVNESEVWERRSAYIM